jgi:hypothetical protein
MQYPNAQFAVATQGAIYSHTHLCAYLISNIQTFDWYFVIQEELWSTGAPPAALNMTTPMILRRRQDSCKALDV